MRGWSPCRCADPTRRRSSPQPRYGPTMSASEPQAAVPRRLDHGAILVADADRSRKFYVDGLGLAPVARPANFDFPGFWVAVGDQHLHIIGEAEPGRARQAHTGYRDEELARGYATHLALEVDDLDACLTRLRDQIGRASCRERA